MSASQATLELRNNTDANFRLWGSFISNGLAAGGWTLVNSVFATGTGWSDVTTPAQNTYAVTEIWQSPAEAGLDPFYVRLRYGSHNNATTGPAIEVQIGWNWTSGSTLGGTPTTAVSSLAANVGANATARRCTVAAGVGYIALCLGGGDQTTNAHTLTIERTRGTDLEPQNEIAMFYQYNLTGSTTQSNKIYTAESYEFTSALATVGTATSWYRISLSAAQQVSRGSLGLFYLTPWRGYDTSPLTMFFGTTADTMGAIGEQVPFEVYGVSRNFMILGSTNNAPGSYQSGKNGIIRFE